MVAEGTPDDLKRELRGDAIHVELGDGPGEASIRSALNGGIAGVGEIKLDGRTLHARARTAPAPRPPCSPHSKRRANVAAVTVARPSLDDVYLRYAGRTFRAAEAETRRPRAGGIRMIKAIADIRH